MNSFFNYRLSVNHILMCLTVCIRYSAEQVTEFLRDVIQPVLDANKEDLGQHVELSV